MFRESFFQIPNTEIQTQVTLGRILVNDSDTPSFQMKLFKNKLEASEFKKLYHDLTHKFKNTPTQKTYSLYYYYYQSDRIWICDAQRRTKVFRRRVLDQQFRVSESNTYDLEMLKIQRIPIDTSLPPKDVHGQEKIHKFQFQNGEIKISFEILVAWDDQTDRKTLLKHLPPDALYQIRIENPESNAVLAKYLNFLA